MDTKTTTRVSVRVCVVCVKRGNEWKCECEGGKAFTKHCVSRKLGVPVRSGVCAFPSSILGSSDSMGALVLLRSPWVSLHRLRTVGC